MRTRVRGVRATDDFWETVKKVAKIKGVTVNSIIVSQTKKYCHKVLTSKKTCGKL